MTAPAPSPLLLKGVLAGVDVVVAGRSHHVAVRCMGLGARVHELAADPLDEEALATAVAVLPGAQVLVCDTGASSSAAGGTAPALADAVAGAWNVTRAVVTARFEPADGGLVVLVAPRPAAGEQTGVAGAALENLARTTSVEWARLGVRVVAVRRRDVTADAALGDLVAFLASPAGAYFSGCVLDLGAAGLTGYSSASS